MKNGLYGFINEKGNEVIPCQYTFVLYFSNGLVAVEKNGKWGFINEYGIEVIECIYDHVTSFSNGYAIVTLNGQTFCINKSGKKLQIELLPIEKQKLLLSYLTFNLDFAVAYNLASNKLFPIKSLDEKLLISNNNFSLKLDWADAETIKEFIKK